MVNLETEHLSLPCSLLSCIIYFIPFMWELLIAVKSIVIIVFYFSDRWQKTHCARIGWRVQFHDGAPTLVYIFLIPPLILKEYRKKSLQFQSLTLIWIRSPVACHTPLPFSKLSGPIKLALSTLLPDVANPWQGNNPTTQQLKLSITHK